MFTRLRDRLTYANVVATLALFIALGGSSYAVSQISGSQIRNASIAGKKLKRNTLGGKRIKESRLGTVPSARNARRIGGLTEVPAGHAGGGGRLRRDPAASTGHLQRRCGRLRHHRWPAEARTPIADPRRTTACLRPRPDGPDRGGR